MSTAAIFKGTFNKLLAKAGIEFSDANKTKMLVGAVDPTAVATEAPKGSLLSNTANARYYVKQDAGLTTNWSLFSLASAQEVTVAVSGGSQFTSIQLAIDSVLDASSIKPYVIKVFPGVYAENLVVKANVHLVGVGNGPAAAVVTGTVTGNLLVGGDTCVINRMSFQHAITVDGEKVIDVSGNVLLNDVFVGAFASTDVGFTAVKVTNTTYAGVLTSAYVVCQNTFNGSTKDVIGYDVYGTQQVVMSNSNISMAVAAASGSIVARRINSTGAVSCLNNILDVTITRALFTGEVCTSRVTTAADGGAYRISQSEQFKNTGISGGGSIGCCLNSSSNSAEIYYVGTAFFSSGFNPALEYATQTAITDTQKVWLQSTNKDVEISGLGLAIVTPHQEYKTGFVSWSQDPAITTYWTYNSVTKVFKVDKRGTGVVHSAPVVWVKDQTVTLTDLAVNYVYMNSSGIIGVTTTANAALYSANIVLFEVWVEGTNYLVAKENHPYEFTTAVSGAWHNLFGPLLQSATSTLAINSGANRTANFVGDNILNDHGVYSTISAATPMTFTQVVVNTVSGKAHVIATQSGIVSRKSAANDTGTLVANGRRVIYRVGVVKDSLNTSTAQFMCIADTLDYNSDAAASNAIAAGTVQTFPTEMKNLEICQVGFLIVNANGAGAGTLNVVTTALQVFGAAYVSGGTSTAAGLIVNDVTNFNGQLSGSETNVQTALDRLDDYGYTPTWLTGLTYRIGNAVTLYNALWKCNTAHTGSAAFETDIANWDQISLPKFADLSTTEAWKSKEGIRVYVTALETTYIYSATASSSLIRNGTSVLNTGDGGNSRWIGVEGKYQYNTVTVRSVLKASPATTRRNTYTQKRDVGNYARSQAVASVSAWTTRVSAADNPWYAICWSPELGLFCTVSNAGTLNRVMTSPDGITWTARNNTVDNLWRAVCWSPELGLFCAIATSGTGNRVITSPDGITWTARTSAADNSWLGICWSAELGIFCAVASTGTLTRVMTSPDGINWTTRNNSVDNDWVSVCWSPELGLFCAVSTTGTGNRVITSPDGITWTARTSAADISWRGVCWSADLGLFCAVSASGVGNRVMTSPDGINWTSRTSAVDNDWYGISWSAELGLFCTVANVGTADKLMTSPDGINWTSRTPAANIGWYAICWSPELGMFCATSTSGTSNRVMTSQNLAKPQVDSSGYWTVPVLTVNTLSRSALKNVVTDTYSTTHTNTVLTANRTITYPNRSGIIPTKNQVVNYVKQYSTVPIATGFARTTPVNNNWRSVVWSQELGIFVATATTGTGTRVMTSPDGITWTGRTSAADNSWFGLCWAAEIGLFCAVAITGTGNRVMISSDGITWATSTNPVDNDWRSVCWSPEVGLFVAVADAGGALTRVMTSPDGINWTNRASVGTSYGWRTVCWSAELGLFCALSTSGSLRCMTSPDGINWTLQNNTVLNSWNSICWSPELRLFCAVSISGTGDRVVTSPDGITWTARASAADNNWAHVCWSSEYGIFYAVAATGTLTRIMTSPDGINWTTRANAIDAAYQGVCWSPALEMFVSVSSTTTVMTTIPPYLVDKDGLNRFCNKIQLRNVATDAYVSIFQNTTLTADRTFTYPNISGTFATIDNAQTFTALQSFKTTTDSSLGAELITNVADRDFSSDTGHWTGTNWVVGSGVLTHTAGVNVCTLATYDSTASAIYQIALTVNTTVAGSLVLAYGGTSATAIGQATGTISQVINIGTTATPGALTLTPDASWAGTIDNVSIKLITVSTSALTIQNTASNSTMEFRSAVASSMGIGFSALRCATGINNVAFGSATLRSVTTGTANCGFGTASLQDTTTGSSNAAIGTATLQKNTTGAGNTAVGVSALTAMTTGSFNTSIGHLSGQVLTVGSNNTFIGKNAGQSATTGSGNLFIGYTAGKYQTTAAGVMIFDAIDRGSLANELTNSMLYGTFNATPASQTLAINAATTVSYTLGVAGVTTMNSGTANSFTMPASRGTNKYVLITDGAGAASWSNITLADVSGTFSTSVVTPLIKAYDANGIKFQENDGAEVGSVVDAGAWTWGAATPAVTDIHKAYCGQFQVSSGSATNLAYTILSSSNASVTDTSYGQVIARARNGDVNNILRAYCAADLASSYGVIGMTSNHPLKFLTNNTEVGSISAAGACTFPINTIHTFGNATTAAATTQLYVRSGTGASDTNLILRTEGNAGRNVNIQMLCANNYGWFIGINNLSSDRFEIMSSTASGGSTFSAPKLTITTSGVVGADITNWGSSATQDIGFSATTGFGAFHKFTSSRRYKHEIQPPTFDTSKILQLEAKQFRWNSNGMLDFGFIAEEVEQVIPEVVMYAYDEKGLMLNEQGKPIPEAVRYRQLTALIIEELKKAKVEIEQIKLEIAALKGESK